MALAIHAALREALPGSAAALDTNLAALLAEIDAVDAELGELLRPRRGAAFLVFHAAWGQLAAPPMGWSRLPSRRASESRIHTSWPR